MWRNDIDNNHNNNNNKRKTFFIPTCWARTEKRKVFVVNILNSSCLFECLISYSDSHHRSQFRLNVYIWLEFWSQRKNCIAKTMRFFFQPSVAAVSLKLFLVVQKQILREHFTIYHFKSLETRNFSSYKFEYNVIWHPMEILKLLRSMSVARFIVFVWLSIRPFFRNFFLSKWFVDIPNQN